RASRVRSSFPTRRSSDLARAPMTRRTEGSVDLRATVGKDGTRMNGERGVAGRLSERRSPHRSSEMTDYRSIEQRLTDPLGLRRRPVAVTFRDTPPAGVAKITGREPSGCCFWRIAAVGRTFYTVPSDHYNCAIGSHTHNMPLPADRAPELEQTLS